MQSNLQKIGINDSKEYQWEGNWYGNSSKTGYETFLDVTYNISDLIKGFGVHFVPIKSIKCDFASCFKTRDISHSLFGRCYEIEIENVNETISRIEIETNMPVYLFINLPNIFLNGIPKSKIMVNTKESLHIEATYEILQTHYNDDCKKYSLTYNQSFDACKFEVLEKKINTNMNCSVPFMFKPNRREEICQNATVAKSAFNIYWNNLFNILPECPVPCVNMITSFGFPVVERGKNDGREDDKGKVYIFFKDLVKVTEDFISYDLLRFVSFNYFLAPIRAQGVTIFVRLCLSGTSFCWY